jgi:hypothetical protein
LDSADNRTMACYFANAFDARSTAIPFWRGR